MDPIADSLVIDAPSADADFELDPQGEDEDGPDWDDATTVSLWEGDTGTLAHPVRQTLVVLLKHRFITPRSHPREWRVLSANPAELRSRMADLFLELVVTSQPEVAFKRQAVSEGGERFPTLLHDKAWTREETLVLIKLRDHVRSEAAVGNARAFVDRSELLGYVASFRPVDATDEAGDLDRARSAIANVYKTGLLVGLSTADRWEISPAVEAMLPIEKLYELLEAFRGHNRPDGDSTLDTTTSTFTSASSLLEGEDDY